jgi:hypothetical protein
MAITGMVGSAGGSQIRRTSTSGGLAMRIRTAQNEEARGRPASDGERVKMLEGEVRLLKGQLAEARAGVETREGTKEWGVDGGGRGGGGGGGGEGEGTAEAGGEGAGGSGGGE